MSICQDSSLVIRIAFQHFTILILKNCMHSSPSQHGQMRLLSPSPSTSLSCLLFSFCVILLRLRNKFPPNQGAKTSNASSSSQSSEMMGLSGGFSSKISPAGAVRWWLGLESSKAPGDLMAKMASYNTSNASAEVFGEWLDNLWGSLSLSLPPSSSSPTPSLSFRALLYTASLGFLTTWRFLGSLASDVAAVFAHTSVEGSSELTT